MNSDDDDRRARLIAALARERSALAQSIAGVRREGSVARRFRRSYGERKPIWLAGAAIIGWLLSLLPARRKNVYVNAAGDQTLAKAGKAGILLMILKILGNLARPAITAFATKKLADMVAVASTAGRYCITIQPRRRTVPLREPTGCPYNST